MIYRLPYSPDDQESATQAVDHEVKNPLPERWLAMTTDERLLQTNCALKTILRNTDLIFVRRNKNIKIVRADYVQNKITYAEKVAAETEYGEWKVVATKFRNKVIDRIREIKFRVRLLGGDETLENLRSALQTLATAVAQHQMTVDDHRTTTTADRMLWMHLDILTWPQGLINPTYISLADLIANEP